MNLSLNAMHLKDALALFGSVGSALTPFIISPETTML